MNGHSGRCNTPPGRVCGPWLPRPSGLSPPPERRSQGRQGRGQSKNRRADGQQPALRSGFLYSSTPNCWAIVTS
jgi:hypothetical protein